MNACIVGVGEPLAGDDAVGVRVVERLRRTTELVTRLDLFTLRDPSELALLLPGRPAALIVDARLDAEHPGNVEFFAHAPRSGVPSARALSSHGIDTLAALELARTLAGAAGFPRIALLTIGIARPERLADGLSPPVAAALPAAVATAVDWARALVARGLSP